MILQWQGNVSEWKILLIELPSSSTQQLLKKLKRIARPTKSNILLCKKLSCKYVFQIGPFIIYW